MDNEDDAYLIFETLNTRGKDLSLTDLVKNHFSKHLKARGAVDHARLKWQNMLETIHNSSADISSDNFIYHFWASRYEAVPLKKLFPKIKKQITKTKANDYLSDLLSDSRIYRSIYEKGFGWGKNEIAVSRSLAAMQLFKLSQPIPAALSLIRAYRDQKIKYPKLKSALRAIEKFHFIFTAITSSRSSGGISAMYSSFAIRLFESPDSQTAANEIKVLTDKLYSKLPSLDEFKVAFKEVIYTNSNSKQKNLVRYILRKFAEHYSYKFPVDYDDLTIEHIHPQSKIGGQWQEEIVGCLGNLLLLDEEMNGILDSKDFQDKKKALLEKGYTLPSFIQTTSEWTPEAVIQHTDLLAETAYNQIWKI